jgi:hypothetical protein
MSSKCRTLISGPSAWLVSSLTVMLLLLCLFATRAEAGFAILKADGSTVDANGNASTQAASHPFASTTEFQISEAPGGEGLPAPEESLKDVRVELPVGFAGNPQNFPRCPQYVLREFEDPGHPCPSNSQVGVAVILLAGGQIDTRPVWNAVPAPGEPALFAMQPFGETVYLHPTVRPGDHGITVEARNISQSIAVVGTAVTLWGVPADSRHDSQRGTCAVEGGLCKSTAPPIPFLTLPSACVGPEKTTITIDSWQNPGHFEARSFVSHDQFGEPVGLTGCGRVPFEPSLQVAPSAGGSGVTDTPSGLSVSVHMPYLNNENGLEESALKQAIVTLPEGTTLNPSSADGLASCTQAQVGLDSNDPVACPEASKLGTVSIATPLLEDPLEGSVYLATQLENPFNTTVAMYVVAEGHGVTIKLPGKVELDQTTGRITTSFDENPQLPFTEFKLAFAGGPRAPLALPQTCGAKTATAQFVPWAAVNNGTIEASRTVAGSSSFQVTSTPAGGACPTSAGQLPVNFGIHAGLASNQPGGSSSFGLELTRPDGNQEFSGLSLDLPTGLTAKLAGIPYCPDSILASIPSGQNTGRGQLAGPSCPAASKVGVSEIAAGAGTNPFWARTGSVYLAGPYKGAPLSLAVVVPAVAGPFDLGNVVVRNQLIVNPETTQVRVVSDPLPRILYGIPLRLRNIRINIDKPGFMQAPTNCDPKSIQARVEGANGGVATPSDSFQVTNCERLGLEPKLALKFSGAPTRRGGHPKLTATLTTGKNEANLKRVQVTLPKTEFLENAHIQTICTRVQYAADKCPAKSIYGHAKAWTPLLDKPLEGPVYLRSSNHKLPDLVASLDGQIHVELAGRIDSVNARIRNTFETVPDAPVTKFVLTMQGGGKGLLVNNTQLCGKKPTAKVAFNGQNGKTADANPVVSVAGCGKGGKGKKQK